MYGFLLLCIYFLYLLFFFFFHTPSHRRDEGKRQYIELCVGWRHWGVLFDEESPQQCWEVDGKLDATRIYIERGGSALGFCPIVMMQHGDRLIGLYIIIHIPPPHLLETLDTIEDSSPLQKSPSIYSSISIYLKTIVVYSAASTIIIIYTHTHTRTQREFLLFFLFLYFLGAILRICLWIESCHIWVDHFNFQ